MEIFKQSDVLIRLIDCEQITEEQIKSLMPEDILECAEDLEKINELKQNEMGNIEFHKIIQITKISHKYRLPQYNKLVEHIVLKIIENIMIVDQYITNELCDDIIDDIINCKTKDPTININRQRLLQYIIYQKKSDDFN